MYCNMYVKSRLCLLGLVAFLVTQKSLKLQTVNLHVAKVTQKRCFFVGSSQPKH